MFYIANLQLPGNPIAVTSEDLLPTYSLCHDEAYFIAEEYPKEPWQIQVKSYGKQKIYSVVIQGDLYPVTVSDDHATHRFIAAVDLTKFVESVRFSGCDIWSWEPQSPDIWLEIAHEEMRNDGMCIDDPPVRFDPNPISKKKRLDTAMDIMEKVYRDFFILGLSDPTERTYDVTHVSRSVAELFRRTGSAPDLTHLTANLAKGYGFHSELTWGTLRWVYCVPMFGPELNCWLCFLVDRSLPLMW